MRASGRVTRKCTHVMRVRAWVCARVRVRMREGGSGWTGVCWRVISEGWPWGSGWLGVWLLVRRRWEDRAGLSASRRRARGNGRTQGKQGGGGSRANTPCIFSRSFFELCLLRSFPYVTLKSAGAWFSGLFLKNFIISDVSTFGYFAYICAKLLRIKPCVRSYPPPLPSLRSPAR